MKLSVVSNGELVEVELGIVMDVKEDSVVFYIGDEEVTIPAATHVIEQVKLIVEENTIPFVPVDVEAERIVLDAEVPESKLLDGELQEVE